MITFITSRWDYYLTHPWEFFTDLYKEVRAFIQRGRRGYADSDVWDFDWYLDTILAGGLRTFSKQRTSHPCGTILKQWNKLLNVNAKRFEDVIKYEENGWEKDNKKLSKRKAVYKEHEKALKFLSKQFYNLWW